MSVILAGSKDTDPEVAHLKTYQDDGLAALLRDLQVEVKSQEASRNA